MVDYVVASGNQGSLIIRDFGSTVQAIIKCTNSATFASNKAWSVNVGGGTASGTFSINGNQEVVVWSGTITTSLYMQLNMGATGTSGLGGPTSVGANIDRATIPGAPTILPWSNVMGQSAQLNFSGSTTDGGAGIDFYLARYGKTNPPQNGAYIDIQTGTGANPVSGLEVGTTYYAVAYAHNRVGYSAPSAVATVTTLPPARVKVGGVWKYAIPFVKVAGVWKQALPFVKDAGVWKRTG